MGKELRITRKILDINPKDYLDEGRRISNSMKSLWETHEIISHEKRVISTPSGWFLVKENNGQTLQLTRIDHLPKQEAVRAYFDFCLS